MRRASLRGVALLLWTIAITTLLGACDELVGQKEPRKPQEPDTAPIFSESVADQTYMVRDTVRLTLPPATGGNGSLTYSLVPIIPGLWFDEDSRELRTLATHRPRALDMYTMTYKAKDSDSNRAESDVASLTFIINFIVDSMQLETCMVDRPTPAVSTFRDCDVCPEMVAMPMGNFMMGDPDLEDARPVHEVTISDPFAVGVYEVATAEWDACLAAGGCRGLVPGLGRCWQPAIANWEDAQAYVRWLSQKTGQLYRLLSESEWEYVARAGTTTKYHTGETITPDQANFGGYQQTLPVGSFEPNEFGLYDVHGNVREWVQDCWHRNYERAPADGRAWESGSCRSWVTRGGSWRSGPWGSAVRDAEYPSDSHRWNGNGFRVARALEIEHPPELPCLPNCVGAHLINADLRGGDLHEANLTRANLTGANLSRATLSHVNLADAVLKDATLSYANLTNANMSYTNLVGASLSYANLSGADLTGAVLNAANLDGVVGCDASGRLPGCS